MNLKRIPPSVVATLLFGSGACALVYQVAWLRELRLVFGASTAATAAVLAIFMGGLGIGSAVLGRVADRAQNPLLMYARLELAIAACAAATPLLLLGVRWAYVSLGGSMVMGFAGATVVRLLLSALVLGAPTFLMGGTLPAATRAIETASDLGRRRMATLYGLNTLGAVSGALASTFVMLELFGTRSTLWLACLVNVLIGIGARSLARRITAQDEGGEKAAPPQEVEHGAPAAFVYAAAGGVGLVFLMMELVWYRMLGPLLGGSTYTFGLILAVALLGIGLGGAAYAIGSHGRRPTLGLFAITCGLEAAFFAAPYALGDSIAILAALLHPLGTIGFTGRVLGWVVVTVIVVLPGAVVSGYQFPVLVGLLGAGRSGIGRHVGLAYAWNTGGAILGSLVGGFVLLPRLSAPGCWQLAIVLLAALGAGAAGLAFVGKRDPKALLAPTVLVVLSLTLLTATGPTAVWRHSPIGAGRLELADRSRNGLKQWLNGHRRAVIWEAEGVESSVGLAADNGLAFILNGKVDGNAKADSPTQVAFGLVSGATHPEPRTVMVIGLGTGSSAGWLAGIESVERVDVVELEPAILEVARRCAAVNRDALDDPKVRVIVGDAREVLLSAPETYDLVVSEPSNPYRAGIASLYTREFYEAVNHRLAAGGIFSQWVQGYEVDTQTVRTIITTLSSVFESVQTWQSHTNDLLLVCSQEHHPLHVPTMRARLASEPFRTALLNVWGSIDLEGFLARFVARPSLARSVAEQDTAMGWLNTDDRMLVEFGLARTVGVRHAFTLADTVLAARCRDENRPQVVGGAVNWTLVDDNRMMIYTMAGRPIPEELVSADQRHRAAALDHFVFGRLGGVLEQWNLQQRPVVYPLELAMIGEALAEAGDVSALEASTRLAAMWPEVADAITGRFHWRAGEAEDAVASLTSAFVGLRHDPWANTQIMLRALRLLPAIAEHYPEMAPHLYDVLSQPFAVYVLEGQRQMAMLEIAGSIDERLAVEVLHTFEPHVPWTGAFLSDRVEYYRATGDPLTDRAEHDLDAFAAASSPSLSQTLN